MGYGTSTMLLLLAITVSLYGFGYSSIFMDWASNTGFATPSSYWVLFAITTVVGAAAIFIPAISNNFGVIYTVPATIASLVLVNIFFFPFSAIFNTANGLNSPILSTLLIVFLNMMFLISIISFIRGGEV